jgi:hypothetical protein
MALVGALRTFGAPAPLTLGVRPREYPVSRTENREHHMLIVDAVATTEGGCIEVPRYHAGHLSLRSETEVTVCLLPPASESMIPGLRELVISPINFSSWQYLTRINALFFDTPGVVRKLAHAIQKETLDIMYEESATIENGQFHRVEILVDARYLYSRYTANYLNVAELLPRLERRLQAICLDELVIRDNTPRLKARPMEGLRNAWHATVSHANALDVPGSPASLSERTIVQDGKIRIPSAILSSLGITEPRVILVSDTRDRVLRVTVPPADVHLTYVRVTHLDTIGSFFRILDALSKAFTAILTLTRLKVQGARNDVELLVYSSEYPRIEDEEKRHEIIEALLSSKELIELAIVVSYPLRAGAKGPPPQKPKHTQIAIREQKRVAPLDDNLSSLSTAEILQRKIATYAAASGTADLAHSELAEIRTRAARALSVVEGVNPIPQPQVFISYNFKREDLFGVVNEYLKEEGWCRVITGKKPDGPGHPFRDEIRDRISRSQGFVAVWGEEDTSPWLIWELGVAQAFGIPVCIFPHENLKESPHLRILPEVHHERFRDVELRAKFIDRWKKFKHEISRFDRFTFRRRSQQPPRPPSEA